MSKDFKFWDVVWTTILAVSVISFAVCLVTMALKVFLVVSLAWPTLVIWLLISVLLVFVSIVSALMMAMGEIAAGLVSVFRR